MRPVFLLAIVMSSISGCAFHTRPYIAYANSGHPQADTAVFSVQGLKGNALGQVVQVDGRDTSCVQAGCPVWVRVIPGNHTFRIRYSIYNNGIASHLQGETDFELRDMRARHAYEANFIVDEAAKLFRPEAKDLGENPDYGLFVGLKGVNQKYHRLSFED
jgi:hypothetical protein